MLLPEAVVTSFRNCVGHVCGPPPLTLRAVLPTNSMAGQAYGFPTLGLKPRFCQELGFPSKTRLSFEN
jgi:hypothetical protein